MTFAPGIICISYDEVLSDGDWILLGWYAILHIGGVIAMMKRVIWVGSSHWVLQPKTSVLRYCGNTHITTILALPESVTLQSVVVPDYAGIIGINEVNVIGRGISTVHDR